jgi:sialic acid synthase SpsE
MTVSPEINIAGRKIGPTSACYVIAEACDNHLGNLDVAKEMVRQAKLAGADAVKFQHHLPDEEMLPDAPMSDNFQEPLYEFLKKHALSDHCELMALCANVGIQYLCTPFSWKAAQELEAIGVAVYKIGSGVHWRSVIPEQSWRLRGGEENIAPTKPSSRRGTGATSS